MTQHIPVTVLTGFLGSGKTTLLNRILTEHHGQRIAVIENEFGEIGVDQDLVINADEEIFEMNNGCICCTVRGDLIRILGNLIKRRDKFDRILLETTGLADPGPVAQTFFVDDDTRDSFDLDGVITLVDAKHAELHLDDSDEAVSQIAFADVILINKVDLVDDDAVDLLERRLRSMNAMARIERVQMADAPMEQVLNVGGFDLDRALELKPSFLEPEYPFEWGGVLQIDDKAVFRLRNGPDPSHVRGDRADGGRHTRGADGDGRTRLHSFLGGGSPVAAGRLDDLGREAVDADLDGRGAVRLCGRGTGTGSLCAVYRAPCPRSSRPGSSMPAAPR